MREVSKSLRIEYLHYQELLQMSQIRTSGLSKEAEARLKRGAALSVVLNQDRYAPQMVEGEIFVLYALNKGLLDSLTTEQIKKFKTEFFPFAFSKAPELIQSLRKEKKLTQEIKEGIDQMLKDYFSQPQV
jgi:F-type H+-transporting ATPase subunit alpha